MKTLQLPWLQSIRVRKAIGRPLWKSLAAIVLWLGISALATGWITYLHRDSQRMLKGQTLIADLFGELRRATQAEERALAEPKASTAGLATANESLGRTTLLIVQIKDALPEFRHAGLQRAVIGYGALLRKAIAQTHSDRMQDAYRTDALEVNPAGNLIFSRLATTEKRLQAASDRAVAQADRGTWTTLFVGAPLMGLMFLLHGKVSRRFADLEVSKAAVERAEAKWRVLIHNVTDVIVHTDAEGRILYVSEAIETMLGRAAADLVGKPLATLASDLVASTTLLHGLRNLLDSTQTTQEVCLLAANGQVHTCEVHFTDLLHDPDVRGVLVTIHDLTERKAYERQLKHQAFHDTLTGLPNRALFSKRLGLAIDRLENDTSGAGVLFLDVDNFKVINDSLGHDQGDLMLVEIAWRLTEKTRSTDTVCRLGGDEFTILIEPCAGEEDLVRTTKRLLAGLAKPLYLGKRSFAITASIGICTCSTDSDVDMILRNADTAMYHAKTSGKARYAIYETSMGERALERLELEVDLRGALAQGQMELAYQPIVDIDKLSICGVEALMRWNHPTRGAVPPLKFISIAEESGLILSLGEWALRTACAAAREWMDRLDLPSNFAINVNVSARQILEADFVQSVKRVLADTNLAPGNLKLEITESALMSDFDRAASSLQMLKDHGVRVAIDDFGTGYSSMSYLSTLPVDTVKIDRTFIQCLGSSADAGAIVQAIIAMGQALGLVVTSEGIETEGQLNKLREMGCDHGQGYLIARPMPAESVPGFVRRNQTGSGRNLRSVA